MQEVRTAVFPWAVEPKGLILLAIWLWTRLACAPLHSTKRMMFCPSTVLSSEFQARGQGETPHRTLFPPTYIALRLRRAVTFDRSHLPVAPCSVWFRLTATSYLLSLQTQLSTVSSDISTNTRPQSYLILSVLRRSHTLTNTDAATDTPPQGHP